MHGKAADFLVEKKVFHPAALLQANALFPNRDTNTLEIGPRTLAAACPGADVSPAPPARAFPALHRSPGASDAVLGLKRQAEEKAEVAANPFSLFSISAVQANVCKAKAQGEILSRRSARESSKLSVPVAKPAFSH